MKKVAPIGRILYGLPFVLFGINHLIMLDFYLGMLTSFLPGYSFTIVLTGLIMIGVGIAVIFGFYTRIAALILAGLLFLFIATIHVPSLISDPENMNTVTHLLKDVSLLGGSLMVAGTCKDRMEAANET